MKRILILVLALDAHRWLGAMTVQDYAQYIVGTKKLDVTINAQDIKDKRICLRHVLEHYIPDVARVGAQFKHEDSHLGKVSCWESIGTARQLQVYADIYQKINTHEKLLISNMAAAWLESMARTMQTWDLSWTADELAQHCIGYIRDQLEPLAIPESPATQVIGSRDAYAGIHPTELPEPVIFRVIQQSHV